MSKNWHRWMLFILGFAQVWAASALAQEFRGTLQGTVTDPSKATIVGAEVVLKNIGTAVERTASTDSEGHYVFQFLPPGNYSLSTRAPGFKTIVRESIVLSLAENVRLDVELPVGETSETVEVRGEIATVQAESSSLGQVLQQSTIENLPLKGHSSLFMFTLATGVVNNRYGEDTRPNDTVTNILYSANGSPPASGDVSVDGVSSTVNVNRGTALSPWVPSVDAVAEFKLQTGTLPAEYGRSGGSIMNIVIKSGTNNLHGSVYEFFRNSALDANLFFPRGRGQKLAAFGANTFGASVGGPVMLPKLVNGKNRTFFFFNYEGAREGNGLSNTSSVPTARMRAGDFSEVPFPIYNPFSVRPVNGVPTRDPFPNNIIPAELQDPVARRIMSFFPEPNATGPDAATPWVQNFVFSGKWPRNYNAIVAKVDHNFSQNHQMFARVNYGTALLVFPHQFEGVATPGRNVVNRPHFGVALNDTYTLTPRNILDLRFGYTRGMERNRPWSDGFDLSSLGFPSSYQNLVQSRAFPTISVTGFQGLAGSPYVEQPGDTWSLQGSISMQRGKHLFKTGGEGRLIRGNFFTNNSPSGSFSFGVNQSGGPRADQPSNGTGFSMASLLLGYGSGLIDFNSAVSIQNLYSAFYFQDDFRVTPKLTLNLGLRWEYDSPRTERYDRTTRGFAYNAPNPLQVPGLNLRGGLLYAGGEQPRGLYDADQNNFAPRVGFAYSVSRGTVVRGGYALSYIPVVGSVEPTGFSNQTPLVSSTDGGITPRDLLRDPFPNGLLPPIGSSQGLLTLVGQGLTFVEPTDRVPRLHNWHLDFQRELPGSILLDAAYVGSRGIGIFGMPPGFATTNPLEINQLDPSYLSMGSALTQTVPNPFRGIITVGALSGTTVQRQQLLRPYPQFLNIRRQNAANGNSVYHSGQLRIEKRMASGVNALVSYTWSKNLTDVHPPQNFYDRHLDRAVAEFDVPHRLTIAAGWQLPFGAGRRFFNKASRGLDLAIGGWQMSTFCTFQSGFAMSFSNARQGLFAAGAGSQRPNVIGDPMEGISGNHNDRLGRYFNTAAFAQPADFTFGSAAARLDSVRNPGMNNINLTLSKDFAVTESVKVQFRASSYNLMNHPVFSGPNTTFGDASFGRVFNQANLSRQTEFALKIVF